LNPNRPTDGDSSIPNHILRREIMRNSAKMMLLLASSLLVLALAPVGSLLAGPGGGTDPRVFPLESRMNGASYSEWIARWYQWVCSLPKSHNPLFETADCSAGQSGPVWFLGGTFVVAEENGVYVGRADRTCRIPSGTKLFFPIIDIAINTLNPDRTDQYLLDYAEYLGGFLVPESLRLEIDGKAVSDVAQYRVASPVFHTGPLPEDNILGRDAGTDPRVASDGYYVMLKPLSVGTHTVRFSGRSFISFLDYHFELDIQYTITIVPSGQY
jgi:hypothetical protein